MYSRALLLTSTVASDARARGATHATERSLPHAARRDAPPTRHSSRASASDADEKPRPRTVSGAPPSAAGKGGFSPLAVAARAGALLAIPPLLEAGADPDAPTAAGKSARELAVINKRLQAIELFDAR